MLVFATCIILKRQVGPSVAVLATVIIGQAIAYGLVFDLVSFFFFVPSWYARSARNLLYFRCSFCATYQ